mgnify:CR=1 FL=1
MRPDESMIWSHSTHATDVACIMVSCCSGAELQVRNGDTILLRELYPDKPTLYERAEQLRIRVVSDGIGSLS